MKDIGIHIKKMRLQQRRLQQEVADACGFTKSHLSKIENGKVVPSLGALDKIAEALHTKISTLLGEDMYEEVVINTREETEQGLMKTAKGYSMFPYASDYGEKKMQPFYFRTKKGEHKLHTTAHESEEFFYILKGEIILKVGGREYHLKEGDGIYFNARIEHQTIPLSDDVEILDIMV
ncbi:MAG: XRE family transcriptional regulator [Spirochaetia bacterium]|nr:XRE family transcriptional regulator [Spirochaetia bacterium]MCF7940851.1 XRE family transcriptional regulator [Spirochaetia bacterium]